MFNKSLELHCIFPITDVYFLQNLGLYSILELQSTFSLVLVQSEDWVNKLCYPNSVEFCHCINSQTQTATFGLFLILYPTQWKVALSTLSLCAIQRWKAGIR